MKLSSTETFKQVAELKARGYLEMKARNQPDFDSKCPVMLSTAISLIDYLVSEVQTLERQLANQQNLCHEKPV
jgi:hypothetical protein